MSKENNNFENPEPTEEDQELVESLTKSLAKGEDGLFEVFAQGGKLAEEPRGQDLQENLPAEERYKDQEVFPVHKGIPQETFFRLLAEEYPQLGVKVDDEIEEYNDRTAEENIFVVSDLSQDSREFKAVKGLQSNNVIDFLTTNLKIKSDMKKLGHALEEDGRLPEGTTKRMLAYWYKTMADYANKRDSHAGALYRDKLKSLGVEPMTEDELRKLFKGVIDEELPNYGIRA